MVSAFCHFLLKINLLHLSFGLEESCLLLNYQLQFQGLDTFYYFSSQYGCFSFTIYVCICFPLKVLLRSTFRFAHDSSLLYFHLEYGKIITWGSTDDLGQSYVTSGKHGVMEHFTILSSFIVIEFFCFLVELTSVLLNFTC